MDPDTPPPEARLIKVAREATGMTAGDAAKAASGLVSAVYWRDVERGHGTRRGQRAPARASARLLARMALIVGVTPERLEAEGERPDAAGVLREILRQRNDSAPPADPLPDDPALRQIMEDERLPVEVRRGMVALAKAMRERTDADRDGRTA